LDSDDKIADVVQGYQVAGRDMSYINRRNDLIRAVTLADVNRVIHRLFNPDNFTFVVVGQPPLDASGALAAPTASAH
jgi:zinc protease